MCKDAARSLLNSAIIRCHYLVCLSLSLAYITKYHGWGSFNKRGLFLIVLEAGKSKVQMPAESVPDEDLLPGL